MATIDPSAWHRMCDIARGRTGSEASADNAFSEEMDRHMASLDAERRAQAEQVAKSWGYRTLTERQAAT